MHKNKQLALGVRRFKKTVLPLIFTVEAIEPYAIYIPYGIISIFNAC